MRKKFLSSIAIALIALGSITGMVLGAYSLTIVVTENASNSYSMLGCNISLNVDYMATNGFFDGNEGLDTRVMSGSAEIPHMLADDRLLFALPVVADSSQTIEFTTGSNNQSFYIIPGYSGYITVTDNVNLELGDNFSIEQSGWVDTTLVGENLTSKKDAFRTYISASGNITSEFLGNTQACTDAPTASGSAQALVLLGQTFTTDTVYTISGVKLLLYRVLNPETTVASIKTATANKPTAGAADLTSGTINGTNLTTDSGGIWYTINFTPYTLTAATQYAIVLRASSGNATRKVNWKTTGDNYADGQYSFSIDNGTSWTAVPASDCNFQTLSGVTATGISSAEHTIRTTSNTTTLAIYVDDMVTPKDSMASGGANVSSTDTDWIFMSNAMPYADNISLSVNGVEQLYFEPESIISDSTLPDKAITTATNNGTFTWGNNPLGVYITLGALDPDYDPPVTSAEGETPDIVPVITPPDTMFPADAAIIVTMQSDPLYSWFFAWSDASGISILLMWWMFYLMISLIVFLVAWKYTHNLLIAGILLLGCFGYCVARGVFPFWIVLLGIMLLAGFLVMERRTQL